MRSSRLINFPVRAEHVQHPLFPGKPSDDPRFNRAEISVHEYAVRARHKGCAHQLGQDAGHRPEAPAQRVRNPRACQFTRLGKRRAVQVCPGKVLHLHQTASPAACPVRAVVLQQAADTVIPAKPRCHSGVFFDTRLCKLLPEGQYARRFLLQPFRVQRFRDGFLLQIRNIDTPGPQPREQLLCAVRVGKPGQAGGFGGQPPGFRRGARQRALNKPDIDRHAARVHPCAGFPFLLHGTRHGEPRKPPLDLHFRHNVLTTVFLEKRPFCRVVFGKVPRAPAVDLGRLAGRAEVFDQRFAGLVLLLVLWQPKRLSNSGQPSRIPAVQPVYHRAPPLREPGPLLLLRES